MRPNGGRGAWWCTYFYKARSSRSERGWAAERPVRTPCGFYARWLGIVVTEPLHTTGQKRGNGTNQPLGWPPARSFGILLDPFWPLLQVFLSFYLRPFPRLHASRFWTHVASRRPKTDPRPASKQLFEHPECLFGPFLGLKLGCGGSRPWVDSMSACLSFY